MVSRHYEQRRTNAGKTTEWMTCMGGADRCPRCGVNLVWYPEHSDRTASPGRFFLILGSVPQFQVQDVAGFVVLSASTDPVKVTDRSAMLLVVYPIPHGVVRGPSSCFGSQKLSWPLV